MRLGGAYVFLQVVQYDYHSTISENNRVHVLPITPTRGLIYDRNGVVLADNRPSYNLTITRERTADLKGELDEIVNLLHLPAEDRAVFDKALKQARHPFVPVTLFYELTEEQIAVLAVNEFRLPGVDVEPQFVRHYPWARTLPIPLATSVVLTKRNPRPLIRWSTAVPNLSAKPESSVFTSLNCMAMSVMKR